MFLNILNCRTTRKDSSESKEKKTMKKNFKIYLIILITIGVLVSIYFCLYTTKQDIVNSNNRIIYNNADFIETSDLNLDAKKTKFIFDNLNETILKAQTSFLQNKKGDFVYFYMNLCELTIYFNDKRVSYDCRLIKSKKYSFNQLETSYLNYLIKIIKQDKNHLKNISTISIRTVLPEELIDFDLPISPFLGNASFNVDSLNATIMEKIDSEEFQ
ncbi:MULTISPECIES: hypothetical protein [unclassified Flavobacterium]|uniref:hypothetical protein n=1 Tax=unclassified Flavobacterium TaxID=196869 RepID=UPI0012917384|nr:MULTISPECIES: hypothetical protein [unclassified Flavobacterium]MQP53242.1 hypothetical protein [Flavobacterium sp. LMO9]MQP63253.1 hypothetical protein [Flavobacterium sp. LMO6]